MKRLDKLWQELGRTDAPPAADVRAVKARVHAVLDADPSERRIHMRKKRRMVLVAAALVIAATGSALAVGANLDALRAFFKGDTAPGQQYGTNVASSVSDENWTFTVESAASDEHAVYLVLTVKALNEESRAFLFSDEFINMDTFHIQTLDADFTEVVNGINGFGNRELSDARTEDSMSWQADADLTAPAAYARLRLDYMDEADGVQVPLNATPSRTVAVGATGVGIPTYYTLTPGSLTVEQVSFTPFTCQVKTSGEPYDEGFATLPRICFRMADGSVRTQSQMMTATGARPAGAPIPAPAAEGGSRSAMEHDYRFLAVQDLDDIQSVIVFDREFPLDGSAPTDLPHDPALDPFQVPVITPPGSDSRLLSAQALTAALGGAFRQDPATGAATCVYRGVTIVLTPGADAAVVDGQSVALPEPPVVQEGTLAADYQVFFDAWGLNGFVLRTRPQPGADITWGDWYIVP